MQTKTTVNWLFVLTLCFSVSLSAFAADAPARLNRLVGPCIDDQTFAVIHLDLTRLDVDVLVDYAVGQMSKHAGPDSVKLAEAGLNDFRAGAGARLDGLAEAGARDIFAVFSMYDFPYFFLAVPIPSGGNQVKLYQQVQSIADDFNVGDLETHVSGQLVMFGLKRTITRLKTVPAVQSRDLEAVLQACADKTVKIMLFPSSDQRRILAEMMPKISPESGTIQMTTIGQDLQWVALGLDGPPAISLSLTIQSASAEGADRMLTLVKGLYALAEQHNEARPLIPELDQILKRLTPHKQGRRLLLQVDSAAANSLIDDIVVPSLDKLRATARRTVCGTNMSGIGKALLIYSNDHNDELPPDLETLTRTVEMTPRGLICPANGLRESYVYRGAALTTSAPPFMVTVYEKASNHGDGRNVAFLDSHVQWVSEESFQEFIEKDNEYRRQKGLPVLPAE